MFGREGGGPEQPGADLTDAILVRWGFEKNKVINLPDTTGFSKQNPFKVLAVDFHSSNIIRGAIIESVETHERFICVPTGPDSGHLYEYNKDDYEKTLEEDELPAGDVLSKDRNPVRDALQKMGLDIKIGDIINAPDGRSWTVAGYSFRNPASPGEDFIDIEFKGKTPGSIDFKDTANNLRVNFTDGNLKQIRGK